MTPHVAIAGAGSGGIGAGGWVSWYVDANGPNANNRPGIMSEYRRQTRRFNVDDDEALTAPALSQVEG